ncbi:hypothetical protein CCAX7_28640 [Capsulimonas corticalis]|uniref:Uncharacterized protein n=1 Tax=Capsulimonas corticalis TaxID=2219043 RepID=A0A402CT85_9BACT|nr:tetratricopeptide repeat protein [Capsulimonas corticalis]BDI30813.1 hypothetical protein CCAX7_28640 [Capsulimonas corticalis]
MTISAATPQPFRLTLFGPMRIAVEGKAPAGPRSRKALWLLALLTLRHGRPVDRAWLAETLWPDTDPGQALANLRPVLSDLRRTLASEAPRLQSPKRHTLVLDLTGAQADVAAFDAAISDGAPASLAQAAALYGGPLLEGCSEEWIEAERKTREQNCLRALLTLAEAAMTARDTDSAVRYYRRAVDLAPWRDEARRGLMEALAQSGDTNAALEVYRNFTQLLRDDPRAAPDKKSAALYMRLRASARKQPRPQDPPAASWEQKPSISGYLPHAPTDLIGREEEIREVAARLRRSRLVTLVGPGGIGKTRLALAVAREAAPEHADGAWLVALDALSDGRQVAAQIAGVLGLKEEPERPLLQSLTERLRAQRLLLVLDNCEHVLESCAQIVWPLLRDCPGLHILITSREALKIAGETEWTVPSLTAPNSDHLPMERATRLRTLMGYESVQLFVERAQEVQNGFQLTDDNALPIVQICARLEGLPLAIELAAAWVRAMTTEQIAARLDDRLALLNHVDGQVERAGQPPPRQQTLRATLDWSYDLLSDAERVLLRRLSVFAGGWSLEAAERVCAGPDITSAQVLDVMISLLDKSFIAFGPGANEDQEAAGRYRFLEMTRQYARERLAANGEQEDLRTRHRDFFLELAEDAYAQWWRVDEGKWRRRLESERDNLRTALDWSDQDPQGAEAGVRLANALFPARSGWSEYREGRALLRRALSRADAQHLTTHRAKALFGEAFLAQCQGDYEAARTLFEQSLSIFRELGDTLPIAGTLGSLGDVARHQGDHAPAHAFYTEAQTLYEEYLRILGAEDRTAKTSILNYLGILAYNQHDYASARRWGEQCLDLHRAQDDRLGCATELNNLGNLDRELGDQALAFARYEESFRLFRALDDQRMLLPLKNLARTMCSQGDLAAARAYYEEIMILCQEWGDKATFANGLEGIAAVLLAQDEAAKAVRLWGASQSLRDSIGVPIPPDEQKERDRQIEQSRQALGDAAFDAAWDKGRDLTSEQAIAYALGDAEIDAVFTQESLAS